MVESSICSEHLFRSTRVRESEQEEIEIVAKCQLCKLNFTREGLVKAIMWCVYNRHHSVVHLWRKNGARVNMMFDCHSTRIDPPQTISV